MKFTDALTEPKKFKTKELRVYASTEWLADNKKKYRQVFDRHDTSYIYVELSFYNKLFDREAWDADVQLICFEATQVQTKICNLEFKRKVSSYDPVVYVREGWGNKTLGTFWKKGTYYWEAYINGEKIGTKYFYIEDVGRHRKKNIFESYLQLNNFKLYEGAHDDMIQEERVFLKKFSSEETRYVYVELELKNLLNDRPWYAEIFVKFFNSSHELKGHVVRLQAIRPEDHIFKVTAGWGANTKGSWMAGMYSAEVVFMDQVLASVVFEVGTDFVEGLLPVIKLNEDKPSIYHDYDNLTFDDVFLKLNSLVGLRDIKEKISQHAQYLEFLQIRKSKGFEEKDIIHLHAVFTGNPGTGKTTVARLMGLLYKKMGYLSSGHVIEADRVDLVGEYIGQTAPKVREIIERARGGILFIDEAYALARSSEDTKDFGREVIEILVKEMSSGYHDFVVIVAGYPKEMNQFIQSNPGLRSRFKHFFEFKDYLPQELVEIAGVKAMEKQISFSEESFEILKDIIIQAFRSRDNTFGNARYVDDLLDKAKIQLGLRIMGRKTPEKLGKADLSQVLVSDVIKLFPQKETVIAQIPVDSHLLNEALKELDSLLGMEEIKKHIHEMVDIVRFYKNTQKSVLEKFSLHTVLVGNPGTGKTTVARIMARLYKALGILERGHLVETDRQGLVAGYVGQTAIKTHAKIDEAQGGILFIDEAYALSSHSRPQGDFGHESIQTLLKRMEDDRGKFFVFVAGYPDNMETFLKANPGLNSRFDKTLVFKDYSSQELTEIALKMFGSEGYNVHKKARETLLNYITDLYQNRDKYFGNARKVRQIVHDVIKVQNLRCAALLDSAGRKSNFNMILFEDISMAVSAMDSADIKKPTIGFRRPS